MAINSLCAGSFCYHAYVFWKGFTMEISLLLMQQIAELFLMILMGYVIVKARLLKGEDSKVISKIVLYLIIPCVIINAFQVDYTSEKVQGLLLAFAASVMLQVLLLIIVWGAGRLMGLNEVEKASVYYSNAGNLIMPIVTFVLGQEWVLYASAINVMTTLFSIVTMPLMVLLFQMML